MKVLHVIPSVWSGDGGPAQALRTMERALAQQGVTVETATTDDAGAGRRNGLAGEMRIEEGSTRRYFAKRTDFYKWSPPFARWIGSAARDYDVLHLHALFTFTTTVASRAARRDGVPYVVRPLGTLDAWGIAQRRPWLKRMSLRAVEAPLLREAAAVHFTSEDEARQARSLGIPMRGIVLPLGVDVPERQTRAATVGGRVRALYLSRLDPKKNVEGLLDAFAHVKDELASLDLSIAGDGEPAHVAQLRARSLALGLEGRVRWLGRVEGDAKQRAWDAADFFVLPSHSENFGIAAAEALAQGLPCLLGEGVALAQAVAQEGAGVTVAPTPGAIAQGLRLMMAAPARSAMSAPALRLARERYSVDAMGTRLKQLYTDILASHRGLPPSR
jgi:glycosyltransferase involved in cell wall biosynthesis